jgi:hypothetical protein
MSPPHDSAPAQVTVASVHHDGLQHTYQLKHEGRMQGEELFAPMIQFRESYNWNKGNKFDSSDVMVLPGKYLNIEVKADNQKL